MRFSTFRGAAGCFAVDRERERERKNETGRESERGEKGRRKKEVLLCPSSLFSFSQQPPPHSACAPPPLFLFLPLRSPFPFTMASSHNVRDVPAEEFIKAYAAHLRSNDKVNILKQGSRRRSDDGGGGRCRRSFIVRQRNALPRPEGRGLPLPSSLRNRCRLCVRRDGEELRCS